MQGLIGKRSAHACYPAGRNNELTIPIVLLSEDGKKIRAISEKARPLMVSMANEDQNISSMSSKRKGAKARQRED